MPTRSSARSIDHGVQTGFLSSTRLFKRNIGTETGYEPNVPETKILVFRDVGFMSYYEVKQIPNFVLAAPIIALSVFGLKAYIQHNATEFWTLGIKKSTHSNSDGYYSSTLAVFMYLWAFLLLFATTNMHIQVIIRFFTSVPPLYWYVGNLWIKGFGEGKHTWMANVVLGYFAIYGLIGIVLFSSFLPPA